jgi:hypothetical protein
MILDNAEMQFYLLYTFVCVRASTAAAGGIAGRVGREYGLLYI